MAKKFKTQKFRKHGLDHPVRLIYFDQYCNYFCVPFLGLDIINQMIQNIFLK